jgi:hypothetical protein
MPVAHKYLCETLKILHCDISVGNVLLYRPDENKEANGLLVDFDFAKFIQGESSDISNSDAGDGAEQLILGEVNTRPTGTKSCGNGVWTVSGIYTWVKTIYNAILREPLPLLPSKPYSTIQSPSCSNLTMISNRFFTSFFISALFSKVQAR